MSENETRPRESRLPGFINDDDAPIGLGDVIKKATSRLGIKPCGGCEERARKLNRMVPLRKRRS
jgi:hypothetical protein